jgi:hypothetical protein
LAVAASLFALCSLRASSGTVSGKTRLSNGSPASAAQAAGEKETVVIWLEEQEEEKPPDTP